MKPLNNHHTPTSRRLAVGLVVAATALALASCGDDADAPQETTQQAPASSSDSGAPNPTRGPQVGSGVGLAEVPYVALNQEALRVNDGDGDVDGSDPADVLRRGLQAAFAWRPAEQSGQFDSFVVASSAWNNDYLRAEEPRLTTLIPMSMRDWVSWGDRDQIFYPEVTVTNETHPADTDTDFSRVVKIDLQTGTQDDPSAGRHIMTIIGQARVHNSDEGWRIDNFQVRDTIVGQR